MSNLSNPSKLSLTLDGRTHDIDCKSEETVLEAALRHGIDAPYGCMAGTCNACQATLKSGQVEMEFCDALSDDEVKSGEILTCQAKPRSESLVVEYRI